MTLNLNRKGWTKVRLGDVIRRSTTQIDPTDAGIGRYVGGGHIDSESLTIERWGDVNDGQMGSTFRYVFRPGQVLFVSARPYLRKSGVVNFAGVVADKTYVLDARPEKGLLQDFLPLVLASDAFIQYATARATGSMNPRLLWGTFQQYELEIPPIDEQKQILDLLWASERHIQGLKNKIYKLDSLLSTWIANRLTNGVKNCNWMTYSVSDLITSGPSNGRSFPANDGSTGIPTLSIGSIRNGKVISEGNIKYIDIPSSEAAQFILQNDDFLVVRGNGNKNLTGLGGIVNGGLPEGCIFPDLLIRLRFDSSKILPEFAAAQWNCKFIHASLIRNAKSTNGIWKINGKDISSHQLVVPSINDQLELLEKSSLVRKAIMLSQSEYAYARELHDFLFNDVFGGIQ